MHPETGAIGGLLVHACHVNRQSNGVARPIECAVEVETPTFRERGGAHGFHGFNSDMPTLHVRGFYKCIVTACASHHGTKSGVVCDPAFRSGTPWHTATIPTTVEFHPEGGCASRCIHKRTRWHTRLRLTNKQTKRLVLCRVLTQHVLASPRLIRWPGGVQQAASFMSSSIFLRPISTSTYPSPLPHPETSTPPSTPTPHHV